jgi:hypothetical protein
MPSPCIKGPAFSHGLLHKTVSVNSIPIYCYFYREAFRLGAADATAEIRSTSRVKTSGYARLENGKGFVKGLRKNPITC